MQVRLTHKLANRLDGVDVSQFRVGDVIELQDTEAALLIAEGWAQRIDGRSPSVITHQIKPLSIATPFDREKAG